ncbi:MAG TPA: WecB/TagA/CpsF family glycosyltransferase [Azospirillum sp.]
MAAPEKPTILSFVNAHAVNLCWNSGEALAWFRASDVLLRDGIGLKKAFDLLGFEPGLNMNGTDFIPLLLRTLPRRRLAVYGTQHPWLDRAKATLETTTTHDIVDLQHGFHPTERYVEHARQHRPDVILLAMGMPRQEAVAVELGAALDHPVLIINGGAIIDFLAQRFERAPPVVQRLGLEWLYRVGQEPRRLFRRYFVGGVNFARIVLILRRAASRSSGAQAQGV